MSPDTDRPAAIVLAAGAGSRFGGGKLAAIVDGRPVLQHVLDALAAAGIDDPVVVVGPDASLADAPIDWRAARRRTNPDPDRGLASSLAVGWGAIDEPAGRTLVLLGDQPAVDPATIRALLDAPTDPSRPVVQARHRDGSRNPVRLEPAAADLVALAAGDRGLGPVLDANADRVRSLTVDVANPDLDRPEDRVAVIAARWASRVRGNAAQVETVRETPDGDFYASVRRTFVADPARVGDPVLDAVLAHARPDDAWLDVGAGAGRYALPLARVVRRVVALDPSSAMLGALEAGRDAAGLANVDVLHGAWPPAPDVRARLGPDPVADAALIAHVSYDIAAILPFVEALEAAARRTCVAVLMERNPASAAYPFWPPVHGSERVPLPALPQFLELLEARGRHPAVRMVDAERRRWADRDELVTFLRRQLWTTPGSAADDRLLAAIDKLAVPAADGSLAVPANPPLRIGIVAWAPATGR